MTLGFPAHAGMDPSSIRRGVDRHRPVSPHTRGWTPSGRKTSVRARLIGFPAHAGMDPRRPHLVEQVSHAGRTRPRRARGCTVSPHTRGWTHLLGAAPRCTSGDASVPQRCALIQGFPAHAGMDPARSDRATAAFRAVSPHTRGWTLPVITAVATRGSDPRAMRHGPCGAVSPHTRGWTLPARPNRRSSTGFPRTRGDGPDAPRARHRHLDAGGFPAHAGMDPVWAAVAPALRPAHAGWTHDVRERPPRRFPRTRGDGPSMRSDVTHVRRHGFPRTRGDGPMRGDRRRLRSARGWTPEPPGAGRVSPHTRGWTLPMPPGRRFVMAEYVVSPHTRGWTRRPTSHRGFHRHAGMDSDSPLHGFPAHAGMDPRRHRRRDGSARQGFPAHAGMDPGLGHWSMRARVSPAHAGMDPRRGASGARWVSPHTRGWTPSPRSDPASVAGFPAHAGMDPAALMNARSSSEIEVSPHTRGWTRLREL